MKVLFAVSNDNVSTSIIQKYQEKYKEIITSKSVYYFNAIIKELQKDKTYDAVVIGEDLEPISNNNYDTIDKFIFDKLDNISDEAYKTTGEDIPIILICSDRRTKSDGLLIKLFGIGIYNALLGNDRNVDMVCNLINKPRSKKEAKVYYRIDSEDVNYKPENESEVSETEIKNILNHYKKIGNNEKKCVESFDSIAGQYNDTQLRIIIKFLPNSVKSILERKSQRYQKLVNGGTVLTGGGYTPYSPIQKNVKQKDMDFITKDIEKPKLTQPVVIPSTMNISQNMQNRGLETNMNNMQNQMPNMNNNMQSPMPNMNNNMQSPMPNMNNNMQNQMPNTNNNMQNQMPNMNDNMQNKMSNMNDNMQNKEMNVNENMGTNSAMPESSLNQNSEPEVAHVKRRGRPKKINIEADSNENIAKAADLNTPEVQPVKRGRGRPKKVNVVAADLEQNNINNSQNEQNSAETIAKNNQLSNTTSNIPSIPQTTAIAEQNSLNLFDLDNNNIQNSTNIQEGNTPNNEAVNLFDMTNEQNTNQYEAPNIETQNEVNNIPQPTNQVNEANSQLQNESNSIEANPYDTSAFVNPYMTEQMPYNNQSAQEAMQNNSYDQGMQEPMQNPYDQSMQEPMQNPYDQGMQEPIQNPYNQTMQETNIPAHMNNYENSTMSEEPNYFGMENTTEIASTNNHSNITPSNFVAQNKLIAFVGTSKNGTSFIVNNLAELLAQKGIKTAILDLTKNKNSYYMFTDNDQNLMNIATQSIKNLERGIAQGVEVNKNLTVYTALPDEFDETENFEAILQTLDNNYSAVLMDCDFNTNINYFVKATEIYLVQSMDALTIQPLTQFLSELKLKNVLDETKLRVIINKEMKLKILNDKMILGGMAKYNEPSMTLQRDLFNPSTIKYTTIPFEMQTYARYLEAIALCQISLSGYSQNFLASLEKLANMVYPLVSGGNYSNYSPNYAKTEKKGFFKSKNKKQPPTQFSSGVNDTLNKMRSNY